MINEIVIKLLSALAFTILIEGIVVVVITRKANALFVSVACNLLTNPLINVILIVVSIYEINLYYPLMAVLEILVVIAEYFIYRIATDESKKRCVIISVAANVLSFAIGMGITHLIFW